jgi:hypothetical protein
MKKFKILVVLFYFTSALIFLLSGTKAVFVASAGVLLMFEWQIISIFLISRKYTQREAMWKYISVVSQLHYSIVLLGSFFALKFWFPESNSLGLIFIGSIFFSLKYLSLLGSKYNAITSVNAKKVNHS